MTSLLTCPSNEQLQRLLDAALGDDEHDSVQSHVDTCDKCQKTLEELTAGSESWIGVVDELQQRTPDPEAKLAEAMAQIKAEEPDEFTREAPPYQPSAFDLVNEFLTPTIHPGAIGRLGNYEVTEVIGHGGFGAVFKAFDPALHRVVAVKVLASHLAHHAVARRRFIREAQAAAAVCHENVVTIHAIEEAVANGPMSGAGSALPKIVMQYVSGGSLQERLDQEGPLELKEILRIGMQTAAGLAAAHAQGLVHRDVKPGNILLENGVQRVKLTDFGLARVVDDASLTLSGVIAGTPQYMSPEQAWGRSVDHRGDLFSLGAVLYAMCVGHSPFRARSTMAVLKRVCEEQPRPIQAINPEIPEWLCRIIDRLLSKSPEARFQTAEEVCELLSGYLAHVQQPTINPEPTGWRDDVAIVTAEIAATPVPQPVAQVAAVTKPIDVPNRRERSGSSFWKWVVVILLLIPFGLLISISVLWFSYRSLARSKQAAAMQAQIAAENATLAERERRVLAEMASNSVTRKAADAELSPLDFKLQRVDPKALAAIKGRWVVLSAEGTIPSTFAESRSATSAMMGEAMPGGMMPSGMGVPATGSSINEPVTAPQLIEFNDREVNVTTTRDVPFMLTILGPSNFVLHRAKSLDGADSLSGTYLIDDDRLVLNWGPFDVPPQSLAKSEFHQLVVCRREFVTAATEVVRTLVESDPFSLEGEVKNAGQALRVTGDPQNVPRADVPFTDREAKALQAAWAKKLGVETEITNSIGMKLRLIPPGKLPASNVASGSPGMGSGAGMMPGGGMPGMGGEGVAASGSQLAMRDGVVAPIYVGVHEVTRGQFKKFVDETGYVTIAERANLQNADAGDTTRSDTWSNPRCQQNSDEHPVIDLYSLDATAFTQWLSRKEKKPYRLLALTEFEFAARAGQRGTIELGIEKLKHRSQFFSSTAAVGSYPQNAFGLHDLIGNAAEWNWGSITPVIFRNDGSESGEGGFFGLPTHPARAMPQLASFINGGDYSTSIERSQPGTSHQLPSMDAFIPRIAVGFRVAIDITPETVLALRSTPLSLGESLVPFSINADWDEIILQRDPLKPELPETERKLVVAVRDALDLNSLPYDFDWKGIEIQRAESDKLFNPKTHSVSWQPLPLAAMRDQFERLQLDSDSVPLRFTHPVLTSPLPKSKRGTLQAVASEPSIEDEQKQFPNSKWSNRVLVRFFDLNAPPGNHCSYRYRLKYVIPGLAPQTVHTTGWREASSSIAIPAK